MSTRSGSDRELSATAYAVLALIARHGPLTPYELKTLVADGISNFWTVPHAQLYRDPPKLVSLGLLTEQPEQGGRRRRVFALTDRGREALRSWLASPHGEHVDLRDPALLKLWFSELSDEQDVARLAHSQALLHSERLARYQAQSAQFDTENPEHRSRARVLALGIRYERSQIEFWSEVADSPTALPEP